MYISIENETQNVTKQDQDKKFKKIGPILYKQVKQ